MKSLKKFFASLFTSMVLITSFNLNVFATDFSDRESVLTQTENLEASENQITLKGASLLTALDRNINTDYIFYFNKGDSGKPHYIRFSIPECGVVSLNFTKPVGSDGTVGSVAFKIINSDGTNVFVVNSNDSNKSEASFLYYIGLDKGTYYLETTQLFDFTKGIGTNSTYRIGFEKGDYEKENNDEKTEATRIETGKMYTGYLESFNSDYDQYKFIKDGACNLYFSDLSMFGKTDIYLIKPDNTYVYIHDKTSYIQYDVKTGMYIYPLYSSNGEGIIRFKYRNTDEKKQIKYSFGIFKDEANSTPGLSLSDNSIKKIDIVGLVGKGVQKIAVGDKTRVLTAFAATKRNDSNSSVTWITQNGHVINTKPLSNNQIEVTAVGPGTAFLTAVAGAKTKTIKYEVRQHVKSAEASLNTITLNPKEKYKINIALDAPTSDKFFFESNNKSVCTVDQKGVIKAKSISTNPAEINVYAYDKGIDKRSNKIATILVNVVDGHIQAPQVMDVSINYVGNTDLFVGEMGYISTLVNNGENNGGISPKYSIKGNGSVKIDKYGHVIAKKAGTVIIESTYGKGVDAISKSITLTVKQPIKLFKVNKCYQKVSIPASPKTVSFSAKMNPSIPKFIADGGNVSWEITTGGNNITIKSVYNGRITLILPSDAEDAVVTLKIHDPVTNNDYNTDCVIHITD